MDRVIKIYITYRNAGKNDIFAMIKTMNFLRLLTLKDQMDVTVTVCCSCQKGNIKPKHNLFSLYLYHRFYVDEPSIVLDK